MLLELTLAWKRHLELKALSLKPGPYVSLGLTLTGKGSLLGGHISTNSAGGSQKKRWAAERKESAETQEYESYEQNDVVDREEGMEELSIVPSAVRLDGISPDSCATRSPRKKAPHFMTLQPFWWKMKEDRTREANQKWPMPDGRT